MADSKIAQIRLHCSTIQFPRMLKTFFEIAVIKGNLVLPQHNPSFKDLAYFSIHCYAEAIFVEDDERI